MTELLNLAWVHSLVSALLPLAIAVLLLGCLAAVIEAGIAVGERLRGLRALELCGDAAVVEKIARRRIERSDLLARIPPMLGLMATIIPLGPGLAALGQGDPAALAKAVTVAFDATVLGLVAGIAGLWIGRLRRRWYEELLERMEQA
jgi:biopolymer transport protein ExbB/TolQ